MKRLSLFFVTAAFVLSILFTVVADVNHGHGPGHGETVHGAEIIGAAAAQGEDSQEEGNHGGEIQLQEAAH